MVRSVDRLVHTAVIWSKHIIAQYVVYPHAYGEMSVRETRSEGSGAIAVGDVYIVAVRALPGVCYGVVGI